jgi:Fe2+ transport system protein FeoA
MIGMRLSQMEIGQRAEIIEIQCQRASRIAHLSVFGVMPGSCVTLCHRHFACVIMVDETEIALDMDVAREIIICPIQAS